MKPIKRFTMKKITKLIALIFLAFFLDSQVGAQTLAGSVQNQPCANNGAISLTVTGLTPPISYTAHNPAANQTVVNSNINALTHVITGLPAFNATFGNTNVWHIVAFDGVDTAMTTITLAPSFTFATLATSGVCPLPSTLQASSFSGGSAPYTCNW